MSLIIKMSCDNNKIEMMDSPTNLNKSSQDYFPDVSDEFISINNKIKYMEKKQSEFFNNILPSLNSIFKNKVDQEIKKEVTKKEEFMSKTKELETFKYDESKEDTSKSIIKWDDYWEKYGLEKGSALSNTLIDKGSGHKSEPEQPKNLRDRAGSLVTPSKKPIGKVASKNITPQRESSKKTPKIKKVK